MSRSRFQLQQMALQARLSRPLARRRYSPDALFYAGNIYRYWHYLTGESSKEIYRQADADQILASFGYHTESNEMAVEDLRRTAAGRPDCRGLRPGGVEVQIVKQGTATWLW